MCTLNLSRFLRLTSRSVLVTAMFAGPAVALAGSPADDAWQFRGQIYLWLPGVDGKTTFPPSSGEPGAEVELSDFFSLGNLQSTFMGSLEARKGRWGAVTDFIYLDFKESKSATRDFSLNLGPGGIVQLPVGAGADATLGLRGWEWTLAGTYAAVRKPQYELNVLGGVRYLKVDLSLDWQLSGNVGSLPPQSVDGSAAAKPDYWDAIVGVRGRYAFGQSRWFMPFHFDIGTGESDLTWQAAAAIGYAFSWGELMAAYRYIGYDFGSSGPIERLTFTGPAVSVAFKW